ncbi:MAG: hypothetical protein O7A06_17725 [Acidobacteria bacterium]|nr:hypothetical protein [Acidobacteriota bacterium]MCZ6750559.1 hypothetical protein [Acidobacteriota bacterium]
MSLADGRWSKSASRLERSSHSIPAATLDPILSFHYPESIMQKGKVRRVSALYRELQRLELLAGQRI